MAAEPDHTLLENAFVRVSVAAESNASQLEDKRAGVTWGSRAGGPGWLAQLHAEESGVAAVPLAVPEAAV